MRDNMMIKRLASLLLCSLVAFSAFCASGDALIGKEIVELLPNGCSYKIDDKTGKMVYFKAVEPGTVFTVNGTKTATRPSSKGDEANTPFYEVKQGKDKCYIPQSWCTEKVGDSAVITRDCAVFKKNRPSSAYTYVFKAGKPVILTGNTHTVRSGSVMWDFAEVVYFDRAASWTIKTGWIQKDNVSSRKDDIVAFNLMDKAALEKDEVIRNEYFLNIESLKISESVKEQYQKIKRNFTKPEFKTFKELDVWMNVLAGGDEGNVNYRSAPGTDSVVRGRFTDATPVYIIECTEEEDTIGGVSGFWYHFVKPEPDSYEDTLELNAEAPEEEQIKDGWIFGGCLEVISK